MIQQLNVTKELTAQAMGSGELPVYATPAVVAFIENTACKCLTNLPSEDTTVGTAITVQHIKASAIGETLTCHVELTAQEGRKYVFEAQVSNAKGETIATATHERFQVNKERFMNKLLQ